MKYPAKNFVTALILMCLSAIAANSQTQMASLRPGQEVLWHRTSPSPEKPDGPVLYELLLNARGTPGTVPMFDRNPRRLTNSPITVSGGNVVVGGGGGLIINGANGLMTFAKGQTFPFPTFPNLAGEVTGPPGNTVVSSAVAVDAANAIVRRDSAGNFAAGTIALSRSLLLPNTTSSSGVLILGDTYFLHNFGLENTFVGNLAGNMSLTGAANSAFGYGALNSDTTGFNNSAFGVGALLHNTTGTSNAAFGASALQLNTTGIDNSAFGYTALQSNTTGNSNAAFGVNTLFVNTTGSSNAAFGESVLGSNTTGSNNTALGASALVFNTTGDGNTAFGYRALNTLRSGTNNIAIGDSAGTNLGAGDNNIYIGHPGPASVGASESNTIRIGDGVTQTATFITGINGATSASGVNVFVNSAGQLGTATSSRRFKQEIADLGAESDILTKLRPVAFYYKPEYDETHTRQYGLVAEEVAQFAPGLVVFDNNGQPQTVRYHFINAMLLNEVQKQKRLIEAQQKQLAEQQEQVAAMQQQMKTLVLRMAAMEKSAQQSNTRDVATLPR